MRDQAVTMAPINTARVARIRKNKMWKRWMAMISDLTTKVVTEHTLDTSPFHDRDRNARTILMPPDFQSA